MDFLFLVFSNVKINRYYFVNTLVVFTFFVLSKVGKCSLIAFKIIFKSNSLASHLFY